MAAVSSGNVARKTLADISNLPVKQLIRDGKPQGTTTNDHEELMKEKMQLMKILADRERIIKVTGIELRKLRINQQLMQEQNKQLAQTNSQLVAERNEINEKIKAFQHDIGCRNGLIKALQCKLKSQVKVNLSEEVKVKLTEIEDQEDLVIREQDADKQDTSNWTIDLKSLGPSRKVQSKEKAGNKRSSVRRQSARFKSEEAKSTEEFFEIPETKVMMCPLPSDSDREGVASTVKNEDKEGNVATSVFMNAEEGKLTRIDDQGKLATRGQDADRQDTSKRRVQSKSVCPSHQVQSKEKAANKRTCVRRQSSRFKFEEAKSREDLCEIPETKFAVCPPPTDSFVEDGVVATVTRVKDEDKDKEGNVGMMHGQGRPSMGRPSRLAAKKVKSYKEIPLTVKMRRPD